MNTLTKRVFLVAGGLVLTTSLVVAGQHYNHHGPEHRAEWIVYIQR